MGNERNGCLSSVRRKRTDSGRLEASVLQRSWQRRVRPGKSRTLPPCSQVLSLFGQIACAIQKWFQLQQVHVGSLTSMITHWTPCHLCKLHSPLDHHRQVGGDYDLKATKLWLRSLAHILEHHLDSDTILNHHPHSQT